jgi:hypothetical protein
MEYLREIALAVLPYRTGLKTSYALYDVIR